MSNNSIIFLLLGLAAGAGAGFYAGRKYEENKADEQIRMACEHHRQKYEAKLNDALKDIMMEKIDEKSDEEETKKIERTAKIPSPDPDDYTQKVNYNQISQSKIVKEEEYAVEGPYEVQPGTYDDFLGLDRYDLTFFAEDEIIMDSNEQIWNDATSKLGELYLDVEKYGRYEPDILYIVNEDYGEGYKITLDMGSYSDYMAGY